MSIFNELLPKLNEISNGFQKKFDDDLKNSFECLERFDEDLQNGKRRSRGREKVQKDKIRMTNLQSINEDDGDPKFSKPENECSSKSNSSSNRTSTDSNGGRRASKKRTKNEVDGILSPEVDKRQKRNASVRAQGNITKQVNVNLTAKLRREDSSHKAEKNSDKVDKNNLKVEKNKENVGKASQSARGRRQKDDEKENAGPNVPAIQIKTEKLSLQPESMDMEVLAVDVQVKIEGDKDDIAMPPPNAPVPKLRKGLTKEKSDDSEEETGKKRTTRTKKQPVEAMPPPVPATRVTRSSRVRVTETEEQPPVEPRPKRTRAKKKVSVSDPQSIEVDSTQTSQETFSGTSSPADKPRPKRTRRGKAAEKQKVSKPVESFMSPKEEPSMSSGSLILQKETKSKKDKTNLTSTTLESSTTVNATADYIDGIELDKTRIIDKTTAISKDLDKTTIINKDLDKTTIINKDLDKTTIINKDLDKTTIINKDLDKTTIINKDLDKTTIINKDLDKTTVINKDLDKTKVLQNVNHAPVTVKNAPNMNLTVVLEKTNFENIYLKKPQNCVMDATVVIDKGQKSSNLTDDNSLLTDDESEHEVQTPPKKVIQQTQPSSAVKEKVQQFEELATRVTRTKTRAMAKKVEQNDNQTPPDKVSKPILSAETLSKMNNLIFNGKPNQPISSSASKPRAAAPAGKSLIPSSTSKLSSISKHKEAAEETFKSSRTNEEDAKRKKEAMLEAKREQQKRKREDKMAAAAAARCQAERDRKLQLEMAAKERIERQAHADAGKLERMKEVERKKQELARKALETEERRKAEETARIQRLADEQRKALAQRRKQIEEQEAMKKEAAIMAKEIEKRQKEYMDKQKMKQRIEDKLTPFKTPGTPGGYHRMEPVYMADGFQYLNSDEDEDPPSRPVPEWSTSKCRRQRLAIQSHISTVHVDRLYSVRVHSPDLREIFPNIERNRLKRTSSAVWRTPPQQLRTVVE